MYYQCEERLLTKGAVYVTLYGDKGSSSKIRLRNKGKPEIYECRQYVFDIKTEDFGLLREILVEIDVTELINNNHWFSGQVWLLDETRQFEDIFFWDGYLSSIANENGLYAEILKAAATVYKVIVETGDQKDAGTNGSVYITLHDSNYDEVGILPPYEEPEGIYKDNYDLDYIGRLQFQKGQTDTFYIKRVQEIVKFSRIGIELDCTGLSKNDNWFLKAVSVENLDLKRDHWFPLNQWLTPAAGQMKISVEIPISTKKGKR